MNLTVLRNLLIVLFCTILFVACSNGDQVNVSRKVTLVNGTPAYIKDRQLNDESYENLNAHGLYGPGFGESYASNSYREDDLNKLQQERLNKGKTLNNGLNNIQENPGYMQIDGSNDINSISKWDQNFINKYDQGNGTNTMVCIWHAPLKLSEGLNQDGQLCYR